MILCSACGQPYPEKSTPYRCECGGVYDVGSPLVFKPDSINQNLPGMWRYRSSFGLPDGAPVVTLGEGNTPLIWVNSIHGNVALKLESQNPTGSYKDRGTAVLISQMAARGVTRVVEDSSGNAGASLAAYAARMGIQASIYVPGSASGPKRRQIEQYGADLHPIPGPRSAAAQAVLREAEAGIPYASHAYLPFGLSGIATIAYEIIEQAGSIGTVIAPVGHGGLLHGVYLGFQALVRSGVIKSLPYFVAVQAAACAPLVAAAMRGDYLEHDWTKFTVAEGVRVQKPVRGAALLREILPDQGEFVSITDDVLMAAYHDLSRMGVYVEPTSALSWAAYEQLGLKLPSPVALILTGSGLKYNPD